MEDTSNDLFAELMDDSADKMNHARAVALDLLELANGLEARAEKMRHLAALMILEAQEFAGETADLLSMEFPMKEIETEESDE
jgi:hypothetical protein